MKAVIVVGMLAVMTGAGFGQEFDPFADPSAFPLPPDPNNPDRDKPKMVRLTGNCFSGLPRPDRRRAAQGSGGRGFVPEP